MKTSINTGPTATHKSLPMQVLVTGIAASFLLAGQIASAGAQALPPQGPPRQVQGGPPHGGPGATQVDINVFYAPLAEHGSWVSHPVYSYVWVPAGLDPAWRPYQEGRWLWTDDGWYWDSAEPFAWATYHYGRWGYEPEYGWFWVPGDTWAPAWVKWRRGGGNTGWAPLAPDAPGYAYGPPRRYDVPVAESWVFVQDQYVAVPDLAMRVLPIAALGAWLGSNPRAYDPAYGNGHVITRFVPPTEFGRAVETEVVTRRLVYVDRYQEEFDDAGGARIGIYRPYITRAPQVPPPPRVMRSVPEDRRVMIRQYVGPDARGILAPSAALLSVLSVDQRQALRDSRFSGDQQIYRRDLDRFRDGRQQQLQQEWTEAERNRAEYDRARLEGLRGREQQQQKVLEQRQQRADQVIQRLERERPDAIPPALPKAPDAPGGRQLPVIQPAPAGASPPPNGAPPVAAPAGPPPAAAPGAPPSPRPPPAASAPTVAPAPEARPPAPPAPAAPRQTAPPPAVAPPSAPSPAPNAPPERPPAATGRPAPDARPERAPGGPDDGGRVERPRPSGAPERLVPPDRPAAAPPPPAAVPPPAAAPRPERPAAPERPAPAPAQPRPPEQARPPEAPRPAPAAPPQAAPPAARPAPPAGAPPAGAPPAARPPAPGGSKPEAPNAPDAKPNGQ